jgi:Protein of unknown function (DUF3237)
MQNLTRRTFAKLSAAAAATAVGPIFIGTNLAAGATSHAVGPHPSIADEPSSSRVSEDDKLQSEFLLDLALDAQPAHRVGSAGNDRLIVAVSGGMFEGPRLKGTIITPGADWIVQRPDGSRLLDVRLLLQTDDEQMIYVSWRGIAYTSSGGALYARILPVFETGAPKYAWLNNVVAVGVYRGLSGKVAYRVYQIL